MARKKTTHSISQAIVSLLGKNQTLRNKLLEMQAQESWSEVAGHPLALHSSVDKIKKGVLVVRCENSSWLSELSFYKLELIKKMNVKLSRKAVSDIRFFVGVEPEEK